MVRNVNGGVIQLPPCPFLGKKSPAMKRLIVFESASEGRKWANGRDNWVADSSVGYGLLCLSKEQERKERGNGKEGVWRAHVVQRSRRGCLAVLRRGRTPILFSPRRDPWPLACSSLLQVQALTAGSSHTDTHYELIFLTLCVYWGKQRMKKQILFTFPPPCFFFFVPFYCQG